MITNPTMPPPLILLVEDDQSDEMLALRGLAKGNVPAEVVVVRDGEEAVNYLYKEDGTLANHRPDLILLDIKLPKLNGLEVLERVRNNENTAAVPVVMLTSSDDIYDVAASYRLGANSYIRKTVDIDQFTEHVGLAGLYWIAINQNA